MPDANLPSETAKFELQAYEKPSDLIHFRKTHVPYTGSPHKHPYDSGKVILVPDVRWTRCDIKTVDRCVSRLVSAGFLEKHKRKNELGESNVYVVHEDRRRPGRKGGRSQRILCRARRLSGSTTS